MKHFKPKDLALELRITPVHVTKMANEIERAKLHTFSKTPLGSFLFNEKEMNILFEYQNLIFFFKRKQEALAMLEHHIDINYTKKKKYPSWTKWLKNAKYIN